jgi:hypothetical protein
MPLQPLVFPFHEWQQLQQPFFPLQIIIRLLAQHLFFIIQTCLPIIMQAWHFAMQFFLSPFYITQVLVVLAFQTII